MRIERTSVPEFGPLRGVELELAPGLNVIFGPNEAGKTTLLDVILARLFRWEKRRGTRLSTVMGDLHRFGDPDEAAGRLELRLGDELLEYPGGPSLLHRLGLEHAGLAGLFCVRSGELELPQTEPGEFWAELKKVLSGLPKGVDTLRERAHEEAGLTPTGQLSDAGDPGRKTRLAELERRRDRLEELEERLPDAADYEDRIAGVEERKRGLERARRERVVELREQREARAAARDDHPPVPDEELDRWRELAGEGEREREEIESLAEELAERREALRQRREARAEAESEAEAAAERVEAARDAELAERARDWSRSAAETGPSPGRLVGLGAAALLLGAVTLAAELAAGVVPGGTLPVAAAALLLAAAGAVAVWRGREVRKERRALEGKRDRIREAAAAAGLEADVAELPEAVRALEDRRNELERERELARERCRSARERVEECEEELEARQSRLEEIETGIDELREELGFGSLEEAERARRRRRELEEEIDRLESSLSELAGRDPESWRAVERPEPEEGEEPPEWDPGVWSEVEEELEEVRRAYRELQHEFVRAGLSTPEDVLSELRSCRAEIREIEVDREAGLLAGEIFGEMDEALEQRLSEALSREGQGSVAELLRRVTGRYRSVSRDGEGGLRVRDAGGREFALEGLSRGTRDQVYLALRVGLAGAALEAAELEEPGFLLLDDAFLTADWERRERLVEAVASLAERGWQVVYLTCDTHLRELFEEVGARSGEL